MGRTPLDVIADAIDNDTLIIVGLIVIAILCRANATIVTAIVSGFLGYIGGKRSVKNN